MSLKQNFRLFSILSLPLTCHVLAWLWLTDIGRFLWSTVQLLHGRLHWLTFFVITNMPDESFWQRLITGIMPRSGKLPVLFLLTGQKSRFSPRRGDSLHQFKSNFAVQTATGVRLAAQNFTSIGADGWECGPKNIKKFHFLVESRLPWPISKIFRGFYTSNYPTLAFQISCDSHHRLWSYCGETAHR